MAHATKIATCNYCGARTLLQPLARGGHELACGSCGAPLHEMKWLKSPEPEQQPKRTVAPAVPGSRARWTPDDRYRRMKKPKKRKGLWKRALEEAFDVIEDIFD